MLRFLHFFSEANSIDVLDNFINTIIFDTRTEPHDSDVSSTIQDGLIEKLEICYAHSIYEKYF